MSGHSKWSKLKHTKPTADAKKSQGFSRVSNLITIAAKQGGNPDPKLNPFLKEAVEKARQINMPRENIERAIKRGLGLIPGVIFEEFLLEAYGPNNIAMIIQVATDNKNRSIPEIRKIILDNNGSLANPGSVLWGFKEIGRITISKTSWPNDSDFELKIIDAGAEEVFQEETEIILISTKENLKKLEGYLKEKKITCETEIEFISENKVLIKNSEEAKKIERLLNELESRSDVSAVYDNAQIEG